ncbi:hypothetical protein LX81_01500 [Palleronia aestuarii]|uniref:Uncharacterized protein n=1 Tax=Palleronia aestuarii TaxID=568105 RepID=A0A2W7NBP2_9RHOB|nr:hypothetical protein [Palleronia aestuarii]PZX17771.1 hypothetical protein LX81_01500 [Palleronia aestuarii]
MSRLILAMAVLAVVSSMAYLALSLLRGAASAGRERIERIEFGGGTMQKMSYVLLVALILYTAIWGGA